MDLVLLGRQRKSVFLGQFVLSWEGLINAYITKVKGLVLLIRSVKDY